MGNDVKAVRGTNDQLSDHMRVKIKNRLKVFLNDVEWRRQRSECLHVGLRWRVSLYVKTVRIVDELKNGKSTAI